MTTDQRIAAYRRDERLITDRQRRRIMHKHRKVAAGTLESLAWPGIPRFVDPRWFACYRHVVLSPVVAFWPDR